jgi:hypothetical protein
VQVVLVIGDFHVERRQRRIDEEVMMPGIGLVHSGRRDAEAAGAEPHLDALAVDHLAIVRPADVAVGAGGCGLARFLGAGLGLRQLQGGLGQRMAGEQKWSQGDQQGAACDHRIPLH